MPVSSKRNSENELSEGTRVRVKSPSWFNDNCYEFNNVNGSIDYVFIVGENSLCINMGFLDFIKDSELEITGVQYIAPGIPSYTVKKFGEDIGGNYFLTTHFTEDMLEVEQPQ